MGNIHKAEKPLDWPLNQYEQNLDYLLNLVEKFFVTPSYTLKDKKIEKLRKERKMTQYQLAIDAGLSTSYIPDIEKGLKCPTIETLDSICYALHITLKDFFTEQSDEALHDKLASLNENQRKLLNEFLNSL